METAEAFAASAPLSKIICYVEKVLQGYAQIYFSRNPAAGLFFLAATFAVPLQGAVGLAGVVASNLMAGALGFSKEHIREGYFAFNGLLTALALGLTYRFGAAFAVMLAVSLFLGVLVAAAVRSLSERYLRVPVLSFPFVLTAWIAIAAGQKFHGLIYATDSFEVSVLVGVFPSWLEFALRSLGAAFFQLGVPSGLLVALGLFIFSRHAFAISLAALFIGSLAYRWLGGSASDLSGSWIGFNFALTAVAVGGVFTVPGPVSWALGLAASALCAVVAAGATILLAPLGVPVLAFPFLFTTQLFLFALNSRTGRGRPVMVTAPCETPEENLKRWRNERQAFAAGEFPAFSLPVAGQWTVTQGHNGEATHRGLWACAWDFEVLDDGGSPFRNGGGSAADYLAWNMPVFAPADGRVVRAVGHIGDNPPGHVSHEHNWGNTVVIWHYGSIYTALSHLARNSITVNPGDEVRKGALIARVGNSGRSPRPHLHLQAQYGPEPGSPAADARLLHYCVWNGREAAHRLMGNPVRGDRVSALEVSDILARAAAFPLGGRWDYDVRDRTGRRTERWRTEIDFPGNRFLASAGGRGRTRFITDGGALTQIEYTGPRGTAMAWFFLGVPRLPFSGHGVVWEEDLPAELLLGSAAGAVLGFTGPFYPAARLRAESRLSHEADGTFIVTTALTLSGPLAPRKGRPATVTARFRHPQGLVSLKAERGGDILMEMNLTGYDNEMEL